MSTTTGDPTAGPLISISVGDLLKIIQNNQDMAVLAVVTPMATTLAQLNATLMQQAVTLSTINSALATLPGMAFAQRTTASAITAIRVKEEQMSQTMQVQYQTVIDQLTADVAAQTTVANGVQTAFAGVSSQLSAAIAAAAAANATPEQLAALTALDASLKTNTSTLVSATTENTAAASEPATPPIPTTTTDPTTAPAAPTPPAAS